MGMLTRTRIIELLKDHVGAKPENYYAGITKSPSDRRQWHRVEEDQEWRHYKMLSAASARAVEKALLDHGCDGGDGGGDEDSVYAYVYRIGLGTRER